MLVFIILAEMFWYLLKPTVLDRFVFMVLKKKSVAELYKVVQYVNKR